MTFPFEISLESGTLSFPFLNKYSLSCTSHLWVSLTLLVFPGLLFVPRLFICLFIVVNFEVDSFHLLAEKFCILQKKKRNSKLDMFLQDFTSNSLEIA